ncbi:hypothetical protein CDA63_00540 [Hymenobacter amundsenii]|uniref:Secretion system C-terminal sorting domain-containing protein n=1 Tax=Hymenobacter amundsenii TaxID=2006685 RepID=A0A246FQ83_9BACT|nr:T9SS type A sorting domain-containing protein [Hymenobacter amundsenii]OWP64880.1 hypothetical protein CDA63_00540 [Hymenobacter amundsenii]
MRTRVFVGLGLLLAGCEGETINWQPAAQFDALPVPRPLNLRRVLEPEFTLVGPDDTIRLRLTYDARTGQNILTDATADTVLVARVSRFRGLYYFVQTGPDATSWVHAARIRHGRIQGFNTGYQQMQALSARVRHGGFAELVRFGNPRADSFRLRFDGRQLRNFYRAQTDSSPVYRVLPSYQSARTLPAPQPATLTGPYPNPARDLVTLDFTEPAAGTVTLYDNQGRRQRTYPVTGPHLTFTVAELPAGSYLLRISQPEARGRVVTRRLLVEQ